MAKLISTSRYVRDVRPEHLKNYVRYINRWFEIKGKPLNADEIKNAESFGILEYVWEWPSEKYPDNYRLQAPKELIEDEYYSRFVKGL